MVRIPSPDQETLWHIESHQYYQKDNPDLFDSCFIILDSDYIVDWWEAESYLYDDFDSPYMEITK